MILNDRQPPGERGRNSGDAVLHARLSPVAIDLVAARFRALGEPARIRIIQELQGGERTISELASTLEIAQPNVSKHVRILQEAGIVTRRHDGNAVYCAIADESVLCVCDTVCTSIGDRLARTAVLAEELTGRR